MRYSSSRTIAVVLMLLLPEVGIPASTLALQTDASDIDLDKPRRPNTLSAPSPWDQPAPPAPTLARPPPPPQAKEERTPSANPLWAITLAMLTNTRERPVFSQSRRPARPPVASAPAQKAHPPSPRAESPQLSLVGTVVGDDTSLGVFVDPETRRSLRLKIGDDFQGWKLHSVQGREVTLTLDGRTATLRLPQPDAAKPTEPSRENARSSRQKSQR